MSGNVTRQRVPRHPAWEALDRASRALGEASAALADARARIAQLDLPDGRDLECSDCGLKWGGTRTLSEHRYHSHNGPVPEHWLEAERIAVSDDP